MISGYPSQESTDKADGEYVQRYANQMAELVESISMKQLDLDAGSISSSLLDAPILEMETLSVAAEDDRAFEMVERGKEKKAKLVGPAVGGWDRWPEALRAKRGQGAEMGIDKDWVRLTGWKNEEGAMQKSAREESLDRISMLSPAMLKTVLLKKIME